MNVVDLVMGHYNRELARKLFNQPAFTEAHLVSNSGLKKDITNISSLITPLNLLGFWLVSMSLEHFISLTSYLHKGKKKQLPDRLNRR